MRNKIKIALVVSLMFVAGCQGWLKPKPNAHLEKDMASIAKTIDESANSINGSTMKIDNNVIIIKQHAKDVLAQSPETVTLVEGIEQSADNIATETQKLKDVSLDLAKAGVKSEVSVRAIDTIVDRAVVAEKVQEDQAKKIIKLEEDAKAGLHKMLKWIIGTCVVGAGACAAMAVFFGNIKGGLTGAAACIVVMTLAIAVSQYMMYIAIGGGIIVLGTFGVLGYQLLIQRRAISDNVWTQEVAKRQMPLDIREKIYGIGKNKGQAGEIQSPTTQKIIRNIKDKLPKGWHISKKDS